MGRLKRALKMGFRGFVDSMGPGKYAAGGVEVKCPHCQGAEFAEASAQLNTVGASFVGLDWTDKSVTTLACLECGCVQWFLKHPKRLDD